MEIAELTLPNSDELEVSVLGPGVGYGESIVLHAGDNEWLIVDSCIDPQSKLPAPLEYLGSRGVDLNNVKYIIATHWHDDHVRGLGKIYESCTNANLICSDALRSSEFIRAVELNQKGVSVDGGAGLEEFSKITSIQKERAKLGRVDGKIWAVANKRIWQKTLPNHFELWALSPSDGTITASKEDIAKLIPTPGFPMGVMVPGSQNNFSIVLWAKMGKVSVLLGSDLENTASPMMGWEAIVKSTARPQEKATIFKIVSGHPKPATTGHLKTSHF